MTGLSHRRYTPLGSIEETGIYGEKEIYGEKGIFGEKGMSGTDIQALIEAIRPYHVRRAMPDPERSALLVIDMQRYFAGMARSIIKPLGSLIACCRACGILVIYTQHGHEDPAKDGGMLGQWWGELIMAGSPEAEIIDELAPGVSEPIISKKRYSGFYGTDLDRRLRAMGVEDLIIGGVMTNLCCETTARDAFVRDYRIFFLIDGTATADEELHLATLKNLAFGFAYLAEAEEIAAHLKTQSSSSPSIEPGKGD